MNLTRYEQAALKRDMPHAPTYACGLAPFLNPQPAPGRHGLRAGDVATLADLVPAPAPGPQAAALEIDSALGDSPAVATVSADDIEPLAADEAFSARRVAHAG